MTLKISICIQPREAFGEEDMKNSELRSQPPDTKAATKHGVSKFMVLVIPTQGKQCDF